MKGFQFSLAFLLATMLLAGALVSVLVQFTSLGAEAAFEQLLWVVWLSSLLTSYYRSTARGWKRIFQTTVITGAIWSTVIGTYLLFSIPMHLYPTGNSQRLSSPELMWHAADGLGGGRCGSIPGACSLQGIVLAARRWRLAARRTRIVCSAAMLSIAMAVTLRWYVGAAAHGNRPSRHIRRRTDCGIPCR